MSVEVSREMEAHGKTVEELTESDQWVNDATRKDICAVAEKHGYEVFALKMWGWTKIRGRELTTVPPVYNFSVDYLFKNSDEAEVDEITAEYDAYAKGRVWSRKMRKLAWKTINRLNMLALMNCIWT